MPHKYDPHVTDWDFWTLIITERLFAMVEYRITDRQTTAII